MDIAGKTVRYTSPVTVGVNHSDLVVVFTDNGDWMVSVVPAGEKPKEAVFIDAATAPPDVVMAVASLFHAIRASK
jgi:hypothetical protein